MVFSTESTAFTKKEKRTKKERKAATATQSLTSHINLALYTYKGLAARGLHGFGGQSSATPMTKAASWNSEPQAR
jgi:hypothetical protein